MHFYRICLIFLHISSALCYLPHLIILITQRSFNLRSFQVKFAYITYWINYCLVVLAVLIWCLIITCRKQTPWQVVQISGLLLIGKFIYIILDVTTRILLHHKQIVIIFDFIHLIILVPAIVITFLLVQRVRSTLPCRSFLNQA